MKKSPEIVAFLLSQLFKFGFANVSCILAVSTQIFQKNDHLVYYTTDGINNELVQRLMGENKWPITIKTREDARVFPQFSPPGFIIQTTDLNNLAILPKFRAKTEVLIITNNSEGDIEKAFKKNSVYRATTILNNSIVSSWTVLKSGGCTDDYMKQSYECQCGELKLKIFQIVSEHLGSCLINVRLNHVPPFLTNIPNNSHSQANCYWNSNGIEGNLLNTLSEVLKVKMLFRYSEKMGNWGDVYPNGTSTGNFLYLQSGRDDIIAGDYARFQWRNHYFPSTPIHYIDYLTWCVPRRTIPENFETLQNTFDLKSFLCTSLVVSTITLLLWMVSSKQESSRNFLNCCIYCYSVALNLPMNFRPRTVKSRYFIVLLIIYSFYVITAYQTFLTSTLAQSSAIQQIKNLEDILNENLKIVCHKNARVHFDTNDPIHRRLLSKWITKDSINKELRDQLVDSQDAAFCTQKSQFPELLNRDKNDPSIYCLGESFSAILLTFYMRRGFFFVEQFDVAISRIISAGLVSKWERDILGIHNEDLTKIRKIRNANLNLRSLRPAFLTLCFGAGLSSLLFLCEVLLCYFKSKLF